jgi:hypothetical protein
LSNRSHLQAIFQKKTLKGPAPEWVGAKLALIRRLLADLENTLQ